MRATGRAGPRVPSDVSGILGSVPVPSPIERRRSGPQRGRVRISAQAQTLLTCSFSADCAIVRTCMPTIEFSWRVRLAWHTTAYAPDRIDDAALALMILSGQSDGPDVRVWRKIDGETIERLWRRVLAYYPYTYNRSKSLVLTLRGLAPSRGGCRTPVRTPPPHLARAPLSALEERDRG